VQLLVQVFPNIMKVAVDFEKQSARLGQRALSQIVWRESPRTSLVISSMTGAFIGLSLKLFGRLAYSDMAISS
jgi:hypothetical protein